jgi:RNA recognition motif-containing protein
LLYNSHFSKKTVFSIVALNLLYIFALQITTIMKIFVAKLAFKTTSEDLRALFEQFGTVESCKVIMDHETGRSKCYGFVEMPNDDEAYKAIVETDETVFMGNELQVKKSRPQTATTPKPEKPARPKRPHHPYTPKPEE